MKKGKLVVFEGIYGSGKTIVALVNRLHDALEAQGRDAYVIDSPDTGRAQFMGAGELDSTWRYGMFKPDFFFELAGRARVCSVVREEQAKGRIVLCKSFTLSSMVYAALKGHDWFREDLNVLEARARGLAFEGEVVPDLTVFVDVPPPTAAAELGKRLTELFEPGVLEKQRRLYLEELARMPKDKVRIVSAARSEESAYDEALAAIGALSA